jgi:hypothetical protein
MDSSLETSKGFGRGRLVVLASCAGLAALTAVGCGNIGWPEEPGIPVSPSHSQNASADERFVESLTAQRRNETVPAPIVTPGLQLQLRTIAQMLQAGDISLAEAQRASERWGHGAYQREVDVWILDCAADREMSFPTALVDRPTAVVSYASVQHRPANAESTHCATIVVSANGSGTVTKMSALQASR